MNILREKIGNFCSLHFQSFESCPSKLEEIDAAIHEQQARADSLFQTDERVNTSKDVWMVDKFYH